MVVLAAINRLDKALLRAGGFDRKIFVPAADIKRLYFKSAFKSVDNLTKQKPFVTKDGRADARFHRY